jgi:hypothetical protein
MKPDQQPVKDTGRDGEQSAVNSRPREPRIVAFCCQY